MMVIGTVTSQNGVPLPFASVYVSNMDGSITGTAVGTQTDMEGEFYIRVNPGEYLTASYVGMQKLTKAVMQDDGIVNFALQTDGNLDDVVIYGNRPQPIPWKWIIAALIIAAITYYYLNN